MGIGRRSLLTGLLGLPVAGAGGLGRVLAASGAGAAGSCVAPSGRLGAGRATVIDANCIMTGSIAANRIRIENIPSGSVPVEKLLLSKSPDVLARGAIQNQSRLGGPLYRSSGA